MSDFKNMFNSALKNGSVGMFTYYDDSETLAIHAEHLYMVEKPYDTNKTQRIIGAVSGSESYPLIELISESFTVKTSVAPQDVEEAVDVEVVEEESAE